MVDNLSPDPAIQLIKRLHEAQNRHNLEAFLDCFATDYDSNQPIHPDRVFGGRDQVRKNWSAIFKAFPDFHSELLGSISDGETVWTEWHWRGSQHDGEKLEMRGIIIFGVKDEKIAWGRLYMEPVQEVGAGIDAAIEDMTHGAGEDH